MFRVAFTASVLLLLFAGSLRAQDEAEREGRRYALLVGVTDYKGTDLSNLKFTENDVNELAEVLKVANYRRVVLMTRAEVFKSQSLELMPTADNIRAQLSGILEDRRAGDTVLLAFAGHGVTLRNPKGFFFCPQGANLNEPKTLVSLTEVYDTLSQSRAEVKLLLVDACRNDPLSGRSGGDGRLESVSRPVLPRPPGGVAALFSCSEGQKAYESEKFKHGVFFHHLIEGMKGKAANRKGLVTLDSLADYVSDEVPDAVKQQEGPTVRQVPHKLGDVSGRVTLAGKLTELAKIDPPISPFQGGGSREVTMPPANQQQAPPQPQPPVPQYQPPARQSPPTKSIPDIVKLSGHSGLVYAVAFSPDNKWVATGSWDKTARVWDAQTGAVRCEIKGHQGAVRGVAFSPDGKWLATASEDRTARVWDAQKGTMKFVLSGHTSTVNAVAFSPSPAVKRLATASEDRTVRVWDSETGSPAYQLEKHSGPVVGLCYSADGQKLVTACDTTAVITGVLNRQAIKRLDQHAWNISGVALSPDGKRVVSAIEDVKVPVWNAQTGAALSTLCGHEATVIGVAFSGDGNRIATASEDRTARVWDASSGQELQCLRGHSNHVRAVAFSPDGQRLATASEDKTATVWKLKPR